MSHPLPRSARESLRELVERSAGPAATLFETERDARPMGPFDVEAARRAAVLMLFGPLDDRPADFRVAAVQEDLDVLLVERAGGLSSHPGQVAFPGGRIDPDDAGVVDAALREAREETGLDTAGVEVLGVLPELPLAVSNHLVTPVLGWWATPSPVEVVDYGESARVFRVPVADLLNPTNRSMAVVRHGGSVIRTPAFHVDGVVVWGFTGLLLDRLFAALDWSVQWDAACEIPAPI